MMNRGFPVQRGFTLVEMIVVIVITGIIGGMVAIFIRSPIQGYVDSARRAEMTDIADSALQRITRDLRTALPNSVRLTTVSGSQYLEFLPITGGGRYRIGTPGNILDFSSATDSSFDVLGPVVTANAGDFLVIYNLGIASGGNCNPAAGAVGLDAYEGCNRRTVVSGGSAITFTPTAYPFPFDSPGHRFMIVGAPVTYVCSPATSGSDGSGTLMRYWGYAINAAQPTSLATLTSVNAGAELASKVSACSFTYDPDVVSQRFGLVTMRLGIQESGESINLYEATHVSNEP